MVVLTYRYGALGNQLLHFAHWIAFAEEHGITLANLAFGDAAPHFTGTQGDLLCRYPLRRSVLPPRPALRRHVFHLGRAMRNRVAKPGALRALGVDYLPIDNYQFADLDAPDLVARAGRGLLWPYGWPFRAFSSLPRHADVVRRVFTPLPALLTAVDARARTLRASASRLVALHVRRGDYADYLGGRFYYSLAHYRSFLEQAAEYYGRGTRFVVCADQPIDLSSFVPLPVEVAGGSALEDLHLMARCDAIIGPPSTFSLWASFVGQVPLCIVRDPGRPLDFADAGADIIANERRIYDGLIDPPGARRDRFAPVVEASGPAPVVPVEVVMPTTDDAQRLARALRHLQQQTLPPAEWDVLVVAGACSDRTPEVVQSIRDLHRLSSVRLVQTPERGFAAAARQALRHSRAGVLVFCDGWTRPAPDWLARARDFFADHPQAALVTGSLRLVSPWPPAHELQRCQQALAPALAPDGATGARPDPDPMRDLTLAFAVRRTALESVAHEIPKGATDEEGIARLRMALVRRGLGLWNMPALAGERTLPDQKSLVASHLRSWQQRTRRARLTAGAR